MFGYVLGFAGCALVLLFASKLVYRQVVEIADILRVPAFLISLVLVAFSTSIPELFVGITSAAQGVPAFSLGDIFGSNIVNLTFIAGLVILLGKKEITLAEHIGHRHLAATFAIASMPVLLLIDGTLSRFDGIFLLTLYALYVGFIIYTRRNKNKENKKFKEGLLKSIALFFVGALCLIGASEIIIRLASSLSTDLRVAPFVIGVFAIAFSTSLPELTYGIRVALARHPELSLADVVGSSAVNATGILGLVATIHPIVPTVLTAALMTGVFGVAVFFIFYLAIGRQKTSYTHGAILLILYLLFVSFNFLV